MKADPTNLGDYVNTEDGAKFYTYFLKAVAAKNEEEFQKHAKSLKTCWLDGWRYLEKH